MVIPFRYGMAMDEHPQQLLAKSYAPAVRSRLSRLPSRDQLPIASWLIKTPVGTGYALQILESLENLATQEESSPARVLSQILTNFNEGTDHPKEIARKVLDLLLQKLQPAGFEERLQRWARIQRISLPAGAKIRVPRNPEARHLNLEISFENEGDLKEKLEQIFKTFEEGLWGPSENLDFGP